MFANNPKYLQRCLSMNNRRRYRRTIAGLSPDYRWTIAGGLDRAPYGLSPEHSLYALTPDRPPPAENTATLILQS